MHEDPLGPSVSSSYRMIPNMNRYPKLFSGKQEFPSRVRRPLPLVQYIQKYEPSIPPPSPKLTVLPVWSRQNVYGAMRNVTGLRTVRYDDAKDDERDARE